MFRYFALASRNIQPLFKSFNATRIIDNVRTASSLNKCIPIFSGRAEFTNTSLVHNKQLLEISNKLIECPCRTVTKFSLNKGKRKTVKAVIRRFFRLHWGGWIRTKAGRAKKLWKKSSPQKRRLRQHVFCNATQNTLLDKMVTKYWKRPKYYVEDPYAPYHTREEFRITRQKPLPSK